jgi:glucokinase
MGRFPELGHVRLEKEGPVAFGKAGSVEALCSGTGLGLTAQWLYPQRWGEKRPTGAEVAELARGGDRDAQAVLGRAGEALGRVCAILGDLLILDRIVIGSLGRYLGEKWVDRVREVFRGEVLPFVAQHCEITVAGLGERLQDCSALAAACVEEGSGTG